MLFRVIIGKRIHQFTGNRVFDGCTFRSFTVGIHIRIIQYLHAGRKSVFGVCKICGTGSKILHRRCPPERMILSG